LRYEECTFENFDESRYLYSNLDVLDGIRKGKFNSAIEHLQRHEHLEGRFQKVQLNPDSP
jgi:hypothetical protein